MKTPKILTKENFVSAEQVGRMLGTMGWLESAVLHFMRFWGEKAK